MSEGTLPADRTGALRAHLTECERCRGILEGLEATKKEIVPGEVGWTETEMDATVPGSTVTAAWDRPPSGSNGFTLRVPDDEGEETDLDLSFLLPSPRPRALGRIAEYDILNPLGRGGMGVVFKAHDSALQRVVAVKVLLPELAANRRARRRFLAEARSAAAINHPNVVTIHAVGTQGETPYLVMECIGGQSLRHRIRKAGKSLGSLQVLRIGLQVAEGLAAAHAQGVIHRDVKPANIMLEDGVERVKLTDFGLALAVMNLSDVTSMEKIVGTPAYMSPEQVRGEPLDARSDLFSLGASLYAMVAGHSPFRGAHALDTVRRVCDDDPPPLAAVDPSVPRDLSDLVQRLLEKAPDDRPQSAAEVAATLRRMLAERNQDELPPSSENELPPAGPVRLLEARPRADRARRRLLAVSVATLSLAVLALAAVLLLRPGRHQPVALADTFVAVSSPPARPALPPRAVLTVGASKDADHRSIEAALEHAGPESTIRLESGRHDGPVRIHDPARWRGLTIEPVGWGTPEAARAVLAWADGTTQAVVELRNTPNVTIRGVSIESIDYQHGVFIGNDAEGVTIDGVHFRKPEENGWAHVSIAEDARGSARAPIRVRNSTFELGTMGLVVGSTKGRVITSVRIENNRFLGGGAPHLMLSQNLRDVQAIGNIFVGGRGVTLDFRPSDPERLLLANNTFLNPSRWLEAGSSDPVRARVEVVNNAILGAGVVLDDGSLARLAGAGWRFRNNAWEGGADAGAPLAVGGGRLAVLSLDPSHPDFLRPAPDSRLIGNGAGGDLPSYIGALGPPAPEGSR